MGVLIALMGATGAGKSVQGDLLAEEYKGVHLSSGKLLRRDTKAAELLEDGRLAPAAEVQRVLGEAIDAVPEATPIILDGTPRTMSDVRWLKHELHLHHRMLVHVVLIELDLATSLTRLKHRDRDDDTPAAVQEKWDLFEERTRAVVDYYEHEGLLKKVDGRGTIEHVHGLIKAALA